MHVHSRQSQVRFWAALHAGVQAKSNGTKPMCDRYRAAKLLLTNLVGRRRFRDGFVASAAHAVQESAAAWAAASFATRRALRFACSAAPAARLDDSRADSWSPHGDRIQPALALCRPVADLEHFPTGVVCRQAAWLVMCRCTWRDCADRRCRWRNGLQHCSEGHWCGKGPLPRPGGAPWAAASCCGCVSRCAAACASASWATCRRDSTR